MKCSGTFSDDIKTDPLKRVNPVLGLVVGVDEFLQDQSYYLHKHRSANRYLHGYGTVCGLQVDVEEGTTKISVSPGHAINPAGRDIWVPQSQCADVSTWWDNHISSLDLPSGFAGPIYLVLCQRECESDFVPLPGRPCRTEEESIAASRIKEDFQLKFVTEPPLHAEDAAIRDFGALLSRIQITDEANPSSGYTTPEELCQMVRTIGDAYNPSDLTPYIAPGEFILLPAGSAHETVRAAFRTWVTEVRPEIRLNCADKENGSQSQSEQTSIDENCVLLARLNLTLNDNVVNAVDPVEDERPYMLQTRLLQEWLLSAQQGANPDLAGDNAFATIYTISQTKLRLWIHHEVLLDNLPVEALTVRINGQEIGIDNVVQLTSRDFTLPIFPIPNPVITPGPIDLGRPGTISSESSSGVRGTRITNTVERPFIERLNVFDITVQENMAYHQRIALICDLRKITELDGDDLLTIITQATYDWTDRTNENVYLFTEADLPGLNDLVDVESSGANNGDLLTWETDKWVKRAPGEFLDHDELAGLEDDDHPQYLLVKWEKDAQGRIRRSLKQNLDAGNKKITKLKEATQNGDAVRYEQAVKKDDPAGGDLEGTYPDPDLKSIKGHNIAPVWTNPNENDVLTWGPQGWIPRPVPAGGNQPGDAAGGDLNGSYPDPGVKAINGWEVLPANESLPSDPNPNDVLTWIDNAWRPQEPATSNGLDLKDIATKLRTLPFATIERVPSPDSDGRPAFQIWFHFEPEKSNEVEIITPEQPEGIQVFQETEDNTTQYITPINVAEITEVYRNVWQIILDPVKDNSDYLRFVFDTSTLMLSTGAALFPVAQWIQSSEIKFAGHDRESQSITCFHQNKTPQIKPVASGLVTIRRFGRQSRPVVDYGNLIVNTAGQSNQLFVSFPGYETGYKNGYRYTFQVTPVMPHSDLNIPLTLQIIGTPQQDGFLLNAMGTDLEVGFGAYIDIKQIY